MGNFKDIFRIANKLLGGMNENPLPLHDGACSPAESFTKVLHGEIRQEQKSI